MQRAGFVGQAKNFLRAHIIADDLVSGVTRRGANPVESPPPDRLEVVVPVCAAARGEGREGQEAGTVVVGEFEDEIEMGAAEEGGEFQVGEPAEIASLGGVRVCGGEDAVDLGTAGEDAVAGFADENPDFGMGVFFFRGGDGGGE